MEIIEIDVFEITCPDFGGVAEEHVAFINCSRSDANDLACTLHAQKSGHIM
jgi:hypothetical protein